MAWMVDVETDCTPLPTTGGHTWAAARRLAAYLGAAAAELGLTAPGVHVLELGAGTGWLGCTVARNLHPTAVVCLTEQEGGLAWLRHNVQLNKGRGLPLGGVKVQACDWQEYCDGADEDGGSGRGGGPGGGEQQPGASQRGPEAPAHGSRAGVDSSGNTQDQRQQQQDQRQQQRDQQQQQGGQPGGAELAAAPADLDLSSVRWDFIVGSDLIYNDIGTRCLPRVMAALAGPRTAILYCHTKHRFDLLDWEFFEQLAACGLSCQEVWEPGTERPPESPPAQFPPADLFPEQRIAVYRITKA